MIASQKAGLWNNHVKTLTLSYRDYHNLLFDSRDYPLHAITGIKLSQTVMNVNYKKHFEQSRRLRPILVFSRCSLTAAVPCGDSSVDRELLRCWQCYCGHGSVYLVISGVASTGGMFRQLLRCQLHCQWWGKYFSKPGSTCSQTLHCLLFITFSWLLWSWWHCPGVRFLYVVSKDLFSWSDSAQWQTWRSRVKLRTPAPAVSIKTQF